MNECVRCGFCCMVGPCPYGDIAEWYGPCVHLKVDDPSLGTYRCAIYEKIKHSERNSPAPMFGSGCSSTLFNTVRDAVLAKMNETTYETKEHGKHKVHTWTVGHNW